MPKRLSSVARQGVTFVLCFALILTVIELRLRKNIVQDEAVKYREIFSHAEGADIVIFGSSTALNGVEPHVLEKIRLPTTPSPTVYDFAFAGSSPDFYAEFYETLFRAYYPKPSLVVLAVDAFRFSDDTGEEKGGLRELWQDARYFPLPIYIKNFFRTDIDHQKYVVNRFFFLGSFEDIVHIFTRKTEWDLLDQGYLPHFGVLPTDRAPEHIVSTWNEAQGRRLEHLIDAMTADGIAVVAVQPPQYMPGRIMDGDNTPRLQEIFCARKIPFLDYDAAYESDLNEKREYFADWVHVNHSGALVWSATLAEDVQRVLDGTAPHSDPCNP